MSKAISQLTAAGSLTGDELVEIAQLSTTVTMTATTVSTLASDNSYNDSANGFISEGFAVSDRVKVSGFTGNVANNIVSGTITVLTAGKMTIGGTDGNVIVDDAAGESVTITKWESRRATAQDIADMAAPGGGGVDVEDEGVAEASGATTLNFTGAGVTATDMGGGVVDIDIPGGGGGGAWQMQWSPLMNEPPTSNPATIDTRNSRPCLDFDPTTQEIAIFSAALPADYGGGGLTVSLYFAATSATSGTGGWDVSIERIDASSLDIDSDSFATAQTVTAATVPGTSGQILKSSVNIASGSDMDSLAAGELFRLRIRRDVANDTATGDLELLGVMMVEQ